ncbi:hypothetical protein VTI74DRAFT_2818 [Chaetomium olivicolor]
MLPPCVESRAGSLLRDVHFRHCTGSKTACPPSASLPAMTHLPALAGSVLHLSQPDLSIGCSSLANQPWRAESATLSGLDPTPQHCQTQPTARPMAVSLPRFAPSYRRHRERRLQPFSGICRRQLGRGQGPTGQEKSKARF